MGGWVGGWGGYLQAIHGEEAVILDGFEDWAQAVVQGFFGQVFVDGRQESKGLLFCFVGRIKEEVSW